MAMFRVSRKLLVLVILGTAAFGVAWASAAIPGGDGKITACYVKGVGVLRVVDADAGQRCASAERTLSWNQAGPQGPAGPRGNAGPQGLQGPPGLPGSPGERAIFITSGRYNFIDLPKAQSTEVARLTLPVGTYSLHGKVVAEIRDESSAAVVCSVGRMQSGTNLPPSRGWFEDEGIARLEKPLNLQQTLTVDDVYKIENEPHSISLVCNSAVTGTDSGDPDVAFATRVRFTAIPVANVDVQPGLGPVE